jgi:transposase
VTNIVVHPADVPTSDKDKRNKNDKVDCRKLGKELRSGNLRGLYIPSREEIENRGMLRLRDDLVKKKTRIKNQIKSMLKIYGIETPEDIEERYWSNKYIEWIAGIKMEQSSGEYTKKIRLEELKEIRLNVSKVTREIRLLSRTEKYKNKVELLKTVVGIGLITSMRILLDIIEIERFGGFDKLNSYVGFIPNEDSSGDKERKGEMTKRCNGSLRSALIESSWIAVRRDPVLLMKFNKLCKVMAKNRAIIRIARMLLNRIRYVLKNMKPYVIGVVS